MSACAGDYVRGIDLCCCFHRHVLAKMKYFYLWIFLFFLCIHSTAAWTTLLTDLGLVRFFTSTLMSWCMGVGGRCLPLTQG